MAIVAKLTVDGVAAQLGCTINYVYQLLRMKRLPGSYRKGREWLIPQSGIEKYLNGKKK